MSTVTLREGSGRVRDEPGAVRGRAAGLLQWLSLRLRLMLVFALVALAAAVSASAIAYWLNRDAVLTRTQNAALDEFRKSLKEDTDALPTSPSCGELQDAADRMADNTQKYEVLLINAGKGDRCTAASAPHLFSLKTVPASLTRAVDQRRAGKGSHDAPYHLYWQRITLHGTPYLVGGAKVIGGGPTGYMLKSLETERQDLNSLAWSLGIATLLALVGAALLAQAAASTVLRPVQRLGEAAHRLGEGRLDTRLQVSGSDELANLARTFNRTAERLEKRVADLSAREASSRRFVADMSHELRTPLTAITAVTEVLEEEADSLDPMIAPAVQLVVSETRRLNDLVENLMEVTRFDAGTARLVLDDVDVADQVTACIDARAWLDAVELDAPRGIVARLDPRRLDVILANLIGNALKHGGSPVRVSVWTEPGTAGGPGAGATGAGAGGGTGRGAGGGPGPCPGAGAGVGGAGRGEDSGAGSGADPGDGGVAAGPDSGAAAGPGGDAGPAAGGRPRTGGDRGPRAGTDRGSRTGTDRGSRTGTDRGSGTRADRGSGAEAGRDAGAGGGRLLLTVRDHGPGIPDDVLPHVFDRFYKASASRPRSEGSGLGLSIAMENALIHGGDITAANSPQGGAVFTLRLPMDASRLAEDGAADEHGGDEPRKPRRDEPRRPRKGDGKR